MLNDPNTIVYINKKHLFCLSFVWDFKNFTNMAAEILGMSTLLSNMRCSSMVVMGNPQCYYGNPQQGRRLLCCSKGLVFSPEYCRCVPANFGRCHICQTYVFNFWLFVSILSYMNFLYLQNVNHFIHVTPQKAFQICFNVPCNGWSCILLVYRSDIYRGRATINRIYTVAHEYFDAFYDKHATSYRNCK